MNLYTKSLNNLSYTKMTRLVFLLVLSIGLFSCDKLDTKNEVDTSGVLDRAKAYLDQGQYRAASIEAKNALQEDANNTTAKIILSQIALEIGQAKVAIKQLEAFEDTSAEYTLLLAEAYIKANKIYSANELLLKNSKNFPKKNQLDYNLLLAESDYRLGKHEESLKLLEESLPLAEENKEDLSKLYLSLGKYHLVNNNPKKAMEFLDKSLAAQTTSEALLQKGALAYNLDELDNAEDHLSNALIELKSTDIITPLRINILKGLIQTLSKSGRSSEALIYSKLLSEATPNAEENKRKFEQAVELYKKGELTKAEEILTDLYSRNKNDITGRLLGLVKALQGKLSEANTLLSEHVDPETASNKAVTVLAETKLKLKQTDEALKILSEKVSRAPNDPDLLSIYGLALLSTGQSDKGMEHLHKALKIDPTKVKLKLTLANLYLKQNLQDKALDILNEAHTSAPDNQNVTLTLIKALISLGKNEEADKISDKLIKAHPKSHFSHRVKGVVSAAKKDLDAAIKHLKIAESLKPDDLETLFNLGQAYIGKGDFTGAINTFTRTLELSPNNPSTYKAYISAHEFNKSVDKAIAHIQKMSDEDITLWAPSTILAEYYLKNGKLDEASSKIEAALQRNATEGYPTAIALNTYLQQAKISNSEKDYANARSHLMKGLQLKPDNIKFLGTLASTEIKSGQTREANKLVEQIKVAHPNSGLPNELLGDIQLSANEFIQARDQYITSWDIQPTNSVASKIYHLNKKLDKKAENDVFLTTWSEKLPRSESPHLYKGMNHQSIGQTEEAKQSYLKVLELNPNSLEAINNLAWLKFENNEEDALALAERGVKLRPNSAPMLDTYGWILYKNNKREEARTMLKKAHELMPNNEEIKSHYLEVK